MNKAKQGNTKPPYRAEAPFRLPESDPQHLREIYKADEWKGISGIRELLEEGYKAFKAEIRRERARELPDTFKEVLDKEGTTEADGKTKAAFPAHVYMGTIRAANYIFDDTETARDIIEHIEKGEAATVRRKPPRRIFEADLEETPEEVSALILGKRSGKENSFQKRLAETWLDAESFTYPSGRPVEMITNAKTKADREKLAEAFRPVIEEEYRAAAQAVAEETGAKLADVLNPKKRTEEQYKRLLTATRKIMTARLDTIYRSNFVCALIEILYTDDPLETKLSSATAHIIARYAALYFFALHPEIDLRAADALKDSELKEVKEIHGRILPFMEKEMKEAQKKKEFLGAWEAFVRFIEAENPEEEDRDQIKEIVRTVGHETKNALATLDKVNSNIWSDIQLSKPTFEQMQLNLGFAFEDHQDELPAINTASRKEKDKGNKALILWGLRFDELPADVKITKELTPYDRLCYEAIGSLYREATEEAGEKTVILTPTQICKAMGYTSTPPKKELDKINASLQKMRAAIIYIDNTGEKKINKKYPTFRYEGALLPWDRMTVYVKGKISRDGIRILAYPPLIDFALGRKQITSFPLEVYQFPISKSQPHIRLAQYLIEQICHMKNNPEYTRKLTFATIFERCFFKTWKQKNDAKEAIRKLLEYWGGKCAFIGKNSRIEKEFIEIDLTGAKRLGNTRNTRRKK